MSRKPMEHRPSEKELERIEGRPLEPRRLAQIWAGLPEGERLGFLHSLVEEVADEVMAATVKYAPAQPAEEPK